MSEKLISTISIATDWTEVDSLQREILRLRDELIGAEAQLGELRARLQVETERRRLDQETRAVSDLEHVMTVNADLEQQLSDMRESTTWRLGRAIVRPMAFFRRSTGSAQSGTDPTSG